MTDRTTIFVDIHEEDTDHTGSVFHSHFLKYLERGREQLLGQQALVDLFATSGQSFVVVRVDITLKLPARWGDRLRVVTLPNIASSHRLTFDCKVLREETVLVKANVDMVCVDRDMKMTALPAIITAPLAELAPPPLRPATVAKRPALARRRGPAAAPPVPPNAIKVHEMKMHVHYEHTDFTGVVYYANYLQFFAQARAQCLGLRALVSLREKDGLQLKVHSASLEYKRGARHGDEIVVKTTVQLASPFRACFKQSIFLCLHGAGAQKGESPLLVKATTNVVCLDIREGGRLAKLPTDRLAALVVSAS